MERPLCVKSKLLSWTSDDAHSCLVSAFLPVRFELIFVLFRWSCASRYETPRVTKEREVHVRYLFTWMGCHSILQVLALHPLASTFEHSIRMQRFVTHENTTQYCTATMACRTHACMHARDIGCRRPVNIKNPHITTFARPPTDRTGCCHQQSPHSISCRSHSQYPK